MDVSKSLEILSTTSDLVCKIILDAKHRSILGFISDAPTIFSDVQKLIADSNLVLPELQGADRTVVPQLSVAAYNLVRNVINTIKAP